MREIKFRGWNGKKMFDSECRFQIPGIFIRKSFGTKRKCILMQYTGLKDKNGVEIYEGDIVKYLSLYNGGFTKKERELLINVFDFDSFPPEARYGLEYDNVYQVGWFCDGFTIGVLRCGLGRFCRAELEVIGNIYENPELLKGEK